MRQFLSAQERVMLARMERACLQSTPRGGGVAVPAAGAGTGPAPQVTAGQAQSPFGAARSGESARLLPRFVLRSEPGPALGEPLQVPAGGLFLISDDGHGVARALAGELTRLGASAIRLGHDPQATSTEDGFIPADLTSESTVARALAEVRRGRPPVVGLVHLLPLACDTPWDSLDLAGWRRGLRMSVKSLFYLAKGLAPDLRAAASGPGAWLVAATAMADRTCPPDFSVGQTGIAGLLKCAAVEWPGVRCRTVHLDLGDSAEALAAQVRDEMAAGDSSIEVGYRRRRRIVYRAVPVPLPAEGGDPGLIDSRSVVLITGGASGITAEAAREIAATYRPTLVLAGRSPFPQPSEPADTAGLTAPEEIKTLLARRFRSPGGRCALPRLEKAYRRLMKDRQIRRNVQAMRALGATVHYHQADVADEQQLSRLIDEVYRVHGRLDGVIHGAGIIEDRLLEEKPADSFDRVFDTKADSAFILCRSLRKESLRLVVFFTSMSGLCGNQGQADYAAANEVVNSLACHLDGQTPALVRAINWGPWLGTGMLTPGAREQLALRGIQMIPPQDGCRALLQEIQHGAKGDVVVIIGGGPWKI
ncbi:MAG: SDR family NAD(P)-dependent oxidoreductase [Thermoguttaceae bacterium]